MYKNIRKASSYKGVDKEGLVINITDNGLMEHLQPYVSVTSGNNVYLTKDTLVSKFGFTGGLECVKQIFKMCKMGKYGEMPLDLLEYTSVAYTVEPMEICKEFLYEIESYLEDKYNEYDYNRDDIFEDIPFQECYREIKEMLDLHTSNKSGITIGIKKKR